MGYPFEVSSVDVLDNRAEGRPGVCLNLSHPRLGPFELWMTVHVRDSFHVTDGVTASLSIEFDNLAPRGRRVAVKIREYNLRGRLPVEIERHHVFVGTIGKPKPWDPVARWGWVVVPMGFRSEKDYRRDVVTALNSSWPSLRAALYQNESVAEFLRFTADVHYRWKMESITQDAEKYNQDVRELEVSIGLDLPKLSVSKVVVP